MNRKSLSLLSIPTNRTSWMLEKSSGFFPRHTEGQPFHSNSMREKLLFPNDYTPDLI